MANELATNNVTHLSSQHPGVRQVSSWRGVRPTSMDEAWRMAKALARAPNMLPKTYVLNKNVPREYEEIVAMLFGAIQMGAEVGLSPMASVQNIAVINGKPGLYGPAMLAVVEASGLLQTIEETITGTMQERNMEAVCTVQRYGRQPRSFTFSYADAQLAKLIGKPGPWVEYPKRMFLARARTFALRDVFPDVLSGLSQSVEELIDIPAEDYKEVQIRIPPGETMDDILSIAERPESTEAFETEVKEGLEPIADIEALDTFWRSGISARVRKLGETDKAAMNRIIARFSQKKNAILDEQQPDQQREVLSDAITAAVVEHEMQQEAPQKPVQADKTAAATEQRDHIDNALDELRRGDNGIPEPVAIKVMVGEDGSKNWRAYVDEAMAQLKAAYEDPEHGMAWLNQWIDLNRPTLDDLMVASELGEKRIVAGFNKVKTLYAGLDVDAKAEADAHFPTLNVGHKADGKTVNWPNFVTNINKYLRDTPDNHRIAAQWWDRHKIQVSYLAKEDEIEKGVTGAAAAAEFTKALFARFPQIVD